MNMLVMFGLMFAVIYFMMMRPAQKQKKEHETFLDSLKKDDEVVTTGGLLGKVVEVRGALLVIEIATNVKVRVLKSQIATPVRTEAEAKIAEAAEAKK